MIRKPPEAVESICHIILTAIVGNVLIAVIFPSLFLLRRWEVREYPVGHGVLVLAIAALAALTGRIMIALQRANIDYRRVVTQAFLMGTLLAVGIYCISDLTRFRMILFERFGAPRGWMWMRDVIDYIIVSFVLCLGGCIAAGWYFRAKVQSAHSWRVAFAVIIAALLLLAASSWARFSYFYIFPNHVAPWLANQKAFLSAAGLMVTSFGFFPLAIALFAGLLLRASRHSSGIG